MHVQKQVDGFVEMVEGECKWWLRGSCDSKSNNWVGEFQGMRRVAELKKVLA